METFKGYIKHFIFQKEENGYGVFDFVTEGKTITCKGTVQGYSEGETVEITGEYEIHPIYNKQFRISTIKAVAMEDKVAIERYLGSGAIKGVGEALAARIVEKFGDDTFRIAQEEPERLSEVKGISIRKAQEIAGQLAEKRDLREAMLYLHSLGITENLANKIYQKYGTQLYMIIRENPYKLSEDIEGVGFKIADDIAMKSGIRVDSDYRVRSGLIHTLLQTTYEGHCYFPKEELIQKVVDMLEVSREIVENQLLSLAIDKKVILKNGTGGERVYAGSYYYEEMKCATKLLELREAYEHPSMQYSEQKMDEILQEIESDMEMHLDELQRDALVSCVRNGVFLLSGGPGTGKTTTINAIIRFFLAENMEVLLAAPTGRAAKRMTETTGCEAKTIHRLLEIGGDFSEENKSLFGRNEDNPLEADVIIIDEVSMLDLHLLNALLRAIPLGVKLIFVGDVDQLSSVGPGQVLHDLMQSNCFPCVMLKNIFRQAKESHIVSYAHKINHGENIDFTQKYEDFFLLEKDNPEIIYNYIEHLMKNSIPKKFQIDVMSTQILTPMRKGVLGVETLNKIMQERLNPPDAKKQEHEYGNTIFRVGDKVMQIRNNYQLEWEITGKYNLPQETGTGVFNGDVGKIVEINEYFKEMTILFDDGRKVDYPFSALEELELAYAITIHKAQGSEYPVIIMPVLTGNQLLLNRNLFYTGVTRARECVILLGSSRIFHEMIQNNRVQKRYTSLGERLMELSDMFTSR